MFVYLQNLLRDKPCTFTKKELLYLNETDELPKIKRNLLSGKAAGKMGMEPIIYTNLKRFTRDFRKHSSKSCVI
jgi:hypothetical protein